MTAAQISKHLSSSKAIQEGLKLNPNVEDAYSLRCTPQIMGPVRDAIKNAEAILQVRRLRKCPDVLEAI